MTEIKRFRNSYGISVILHIALAIAVWLWVNNAPRLNPIEPKITWIQLEPSTPKAKDVASKNQRIVDTLLVEKTEKAAPDAFLGEQTQTTAKQTVAVHNKGETKSSPQVAPQAIQPKLAIANLGAKILPKAKDFTANSSKNWATAGDMSPTEYIKGFEQSDRTALNTKEFVYYGYFKRIKERLDIVWSDLLKAQVDRVYRMGRTIASDMDHTTRLVVVLDPKGEIKNVQLVEPSGTTDLDDTAIKAFNQAGPFPNPPKGIVEADGLIRIHWDFVLKT